MDLSAFGTQSDDGIHDDRDDDRNVLELIR